MNHRFGSALWVPIQGLQLENHFSSERDVLHALASGDILFMR